MGEIADEHVERFASGEWDMRHRHVPRVTDPLHYHTKLKFVRMTMTTEKAENAADLLADLPSGWEEYMDDDNPPF